MPQVSKKKLDKFVENELEKQLWKSVSKITDIVSASQFFSDLLTQTEKTMLSKRLACAILLIRGKTASEIKNILKISNSTVGIVAAWTKNSKPKTQKILQEFSKEKNWEAILNRVEEILSKLPPRYGSNWSRIGKQKHIDSLKRPARSLLR